MILGAGRASKEDAIDYGAGIVLEKKTGDFVRQGETLAVLYTNDETKIRISKFFGVPVGKLFYSE